MAIYHCCIKIIKRSEGRSAVAAAAYRSGERLINEWDGMTHDYTKKCGIVHTGILLPSHAPSEFQDRSALWNSVEKIEKSRDAQLDRREQIRLVRAYVRDTFVSSGMCADFSIHDKGDGNPHAHIMLTLRPLKENGEWGAKCRKEYDLDGHGRRIRIVPVGCIDPVAFETAAGSIQPTGTIRARPKRGGRRGPSMQIGR